MFTTIIDITAREILDSRGNPTVEVDVMLDNGKVKQTFSLNRSYFGLFIPAGLWRQMHNFSTNSLALVLSSTRYNADDYIREYDHYIEFSKHDKK